MKVISTDVNMYNPSILVDGCREAGIPLTWLQIDQLIRYYEMLAEKNKVMNLTAVIQWEDVQVRHYLDSLLLSKVMDLSAVRSVLDLGTGAGFPGIPLKIVFPHLHMTLADSLQKRIRFLDEVIRELALTGIRTVHGRAEDLGHLPEFRERYDLVVSRAVANLSSLSEYCIPFVRTGGVFVSYKASEVEEEVRAAEAAVRKLGGEKPAVTTLPLPMSEMARSFVVVRKKKMTPSCYPRKAGIPSKNPLT